MNEEFDLTISINQESHHFEKVPRVIEINAAGNIKEFIPKDGDKFRSYLNSKLAEIQNQIETSSDSSLEERMLALENNPDDDDFDSMIKACHDHFWAITDPRINTQN